MHKGQVIHNPKFNIVKIRHCDIVTHCPYCHFFIIVIVTKGLIFLATETTQGRQAQSISKG